MIEPCHQPFRIDFHNQLHRKIAVEFELKMLQLYGPTLGIYCLPTLTDENIWNGIIFVRQGYFKDARFKFALHLHDFPQKQPKLIFLSKLYHPLVSAAGELDVGCTLSEMWCYYSDNMLYNFMKDFKRIFTDKHRLSNRFSLNPAAAQLYEANPHEFITKAMQSVSDSVERMQEHEQGWSLQASEGNEETVQIKECLGEIVKMQHLKTEQKVQLFLQRLLQ